MLDPRLTLIIGGATSAIARTVVSEFAGECRVIPLVRRKVPKNFFGCAPVEPVEVDYFSEEPFDFPLMDREISNDGYMTSAWGSRGYGTDHIDEWFDEPRPHDRLPSFRHQGRNGLVLIHVVSKNSVGRNGNGKKYSYPRPTVALNIPQGGPTVLSVDTAGD
jgi:hypothetical protein